MSAIDTGPRVLHCPACLREATHHFSHVDETPEGSLSWFRCACGQLRSLDFVSKPRPRPQPNMRAVSHTGEDWWPMSFEPELGGGG